MSGLDSVTWPASPERRMTASSARVGTLEIRSHIIFFSLADEAECVGRTLDERLSSDRILLANLSNLSSTFALGTGVVTSSDIACTDRGAAGGFLNGSWHLRGGISAANLEYAL